MRVLAETAAHGVSCRSFRATPECSPSGAAILTGRHANSSFDGEGPGLSLGRHDGPEESAA